jgi:tetratricopeptide (TPR) repeat protein
MSMAYGQIFRSAAGPAREVPRAKSVAHARRALEMAGDDSNALAYAGFIVLLADQDIAAARAALDRAVALTPNSASAYGYRALVLSMVGEAGQAIEDANRALRLSPLDATNYQPQMALVIAHIVLARFDEAVAWAHKAIQSAPPRYPMSYAWLIVAECGRGNAAEAERQVKRLAEILPNFTGETLQKLFDIFPPALRTRALELMRGAEVCGP